MVQYDPYATLYDTNLPTRPKELDEQSTPTKSNKPSSTQTAGDSIEIFDGPAWFNHQRPSPRSSGSSHGGEPYPQMHPQVRRLSMNHSPQRHYCSKCHMRRPSQEHLRHRSQDRSPVEENWEGFCPDISMPTESPHRSTSRHHVRQHSGLCPADMVTHERHETCSSPTQFTVAKHRGCHHNKSGYHQDCHCETIIPTENLAERYGLVEEPSEIVQRRRSLEKDAADQVAEIMHEEMLADMEARQSRI